MINVEDLHRQWMEDPSYRKEFEAQEVEFAIAEAMIEARSRAGLTQQQLADRMDTSQSAIARLESGKLNPSAKMLQRVAEATGTRLQISFEPVPA